MGDKETAEVPLIVRRPPIISDNSTRSVVVVEGQDVELKCFASGYPPPEIYWRRQDNDPLPKNADGVQSSIVKGNILSIRNVTKDNRGTYYCVATNVVGQGARRNVDVEVEFAPVLRIPRKRLGQALQFDMDLECHIEAYPPPAIRWYDGEGRLITIEKIQYANYTCEAENKLGEATGHVVLFETVPICPPACDGYNYISAESRIQSHTLSHVLTLH